MPPPRPRPRRRHDRPADRATVPRHGHVVHARRDGALPGRSRRRAGARRRAAPRSRPASGRSRASTRASDLSRLNAAAGELGRGRRPARRRARAPRCAPARTRTAASTRPILPALVAAGYDRTFDELDERPARPASGWRAASRASSSIPSTAAHASSAARPSTWAASARASRPAVLCSRCTGPGPVCRAALVDLGGDVALVRTDAGRRPLAGRDRRRAARPARR